MRRNLLGLTLRTYMSGKEKGKNIEQKEKQSAKTFSTVVNENFSIGQL